MRVKREDSGPDQVVQAPGGQLCRSSGDTRRVERELSNLCVCERFRVDGLKRYVNDDRFRVDGDKNMRLLAFAFTIVFVWTGPNSSRVNFQHLRFITWKVNFRK